MTFVVTDSCINCKHTDCVEVCPVDAIFGEDELPESQEHFIELNAQLTQQWPVITEQKDPLPDAANWEGVENKIVELQR